MPLTAYQVHRQPTRLNVCQTPARRVTVLLHTRLGKSELPGLRWKDLGLKAGRSTVLRSTKVEARHVRLTSSEQGILVGCRGHQTEPP